MDLQAGQSSSTAAHAGAGRRRDAPARWPSRPYGSTALHWAIEGNQPDAVTILLNAGAALGVENQFGETPLLLATTHDAHAPDHRPLVALLRARGAGVDARAAAALGQSDDLSRMMDADPSQLQALWRHGCTPLHWAARNGHVETMQALLDRGADLAATDGNGWTPVFPAAYWGQHASVVALLLERGASLGHRDRFGNTIDAYDVGPAVGSVLRNHGKTP